MLLGSHHSRILQNGQHQHVYVMHGELRWRGRVPGLMFMLLARVRRTKNRVAIVIGLEISGRSTGLE